MNTERERAAPAGPREKADSLSSNPRLVDPWIAAAHEYARFSPDYIAAATEWCRANKHEYVDCPYGGCRGCSRKAGK